MANPANSPSLRLGGHLEKSRQHLHAWLHSASSGITTFPVTRWWESCWKWWVLDVTDTGQLQRIAGGTPFLRRAGVAALYRPGLRFEEWQEKGGSASESWILFTASGPMQRTLQTLTSRRGYCHLQDPGCVISRRVEQISGELFSRQPGFQWRAQAAFLELLARVAASEPAAPNLRRISPARRHPAPSGLPGLVEHHIRSRIAEPISVSDLARHAGLGLSTFAHTYRNVSGESPYRTIIRLKMEAAKRLLLHEGCSVKETAARLGYSSEFQFSRAFKREEGHAPAVHVQAMAGKGAARR